MTDPLRAVHEQAEAEFQPYGDVEIVATFGEPQAEYAAFHKSAAAVDRPQRGLVEVGGDDRQPFLNNLLTNQVYDKATKAGLTVGMGVYAFLLNAKTGRIVADVNVIERGDVTWLETDRRLAAGLIAGLDRYKFAERVTFTDRSGDFRQVGVYGPAADNVVGRELALMASDTIELHGGPVVVWREDPTGEPGYHLFAATERARELWMKLVAGGVRPAGWAAFNACRVEAGRPLFGIDFDETTLPAETGLLDRAVSFTKGCYPGQEVVARMHARKQVAKKVVGLKVADGALPIAGAALTDDDGNVVGGVTSSTISPVRSNAALAIAMVKRSHFSTGTVLNVEAEGARRRAVVAELPFG